MKKITLSPSIMCADLTNLKESISEIEKIGIDALHVDLIDGNFSPSMPLGIESIKEMKEITDIPFDIHIMSNNNELFIKEMLDIGAQHISFHYESSLHVDRYIQLIKNNGSKVGIALNPSTSLSVLDYILPEVDTVVLMLINPGFAGNKHEKQVSYANKKIKDLKDLIDKKGLSTSIQVDGRVSLEAIPELVKSGADNLVLGSTSLFRKGKSLLENKQLIQEAVDQIEKEFLYVNTKCN